MDEKFMRRYESFKNSLASLSEARERDMSDSFVLSGTSAKFSIMRLPDLLQAHRERFCENLFWQE